MSDGALKRQQLQERLLQSPFNALLDLEVVSADPEKQEVTTRLKMRPEFERLAGTGHWHGGPIASAMDIVGDYALAMMFCNPLPTINLRVDYLGLERGPLRWSHSFGAAARPWGLVDVDVLNTAGELLAIGRANYSMAASADNAGIKWFHYKAGGWL